MKIDPSPFISRDDERFDAPFLLDLAGLAAVTDKRCMLVAPADYFSTPPAGFDEFHHRGPVNFLSLYRSPHPDLVKPLDLPAYEADLAIPIADCNQCDGAGKIGKPCEACDGFGETECECCGSMRRCTECAGDGEAEERTETCPACAGHGRTTTSADLILRCPATSRLLTIDLRFLRRIQGLGEPFTIHRRHDPQADEAMNHPHMAAPDHPVIIRFPAVPDALALIQPIKRHIREPVFRSALAAQWPELCQNHPLDD